MTIVKRILRVQAIYFCRRDTLQWILCRFGPNIMPVWQHCHTCFFLIEFIEQSNCEQTGKISDTGYHVLHWGTIRSHGSARLALPAKKSTSQSDVGLQGSPTKTIKDHSLTDFADCIATLEQSSETRVRYGDRKYFGYIITHTAPNTSVANNGK